MRNVTFTVLALLLLVIPCAASNITISGDMGETYIRWTWTTPIDTVNVYIDGDLEYANYTLDYYYLTGLNPNEEHCIQIIQVINNTTTGDQATSAIRTTTPHLVMLTLLLLAIGFALITLFSQLGIFSLLCAVFTFSIASYGKTQAYGYLGMDLLFTAVIIFAGIWAVIAMILLAKDYFAWN